MESKLGIVATGVAEDGSRRYRLTGLPGLPKDIPGLIKREARDWSTAGSGPALAPRDVAAGYAVRLKTDLGAITIRLLRGPDPVELIGTVESFDTERPVREIYGIGYGDLVVIPSTDYLHLVETSRR